MLHLTSRINAFLKDAFYWYAVAGTEGKTRAERQSIYIFAVVILAANVAILGSALFYFFYDPEATWLGNLLCLANSVTLALPIVGRRNRFLTEILTSILVGLFVTGLCYVYGAGAGFNTILLIGVMFLAMECGTKRPGSMAIVTAPLLILFVFLPILFPQPAPYLPISPELIEMMSRGNVVSTIGVTLLSFLVILARTEKAEEALELEYARSEMLLENLLPSGIAKRLKENPTSTIADEHTCVTILFADIVGFTPLASAMEPNALVTLLNSIFSEFDDLVVRHRLEKIKTIGDAYMVAGGLEHTNPRHLQSMADLALDMLAATARLSETADKPIKIRVGMHTGKAVAGVIGTQKVFYDVWGETVNTASRLESHGEPSRILVTASTKTLLDDVFCFERRGITEIKGMKPTELFWLISRQD
ncbi:MAG: adenylate/guanylate cyclase domain-containing protein [Pseudomonadota bacterium]